MAKIISSLPGSTGVLSRTSQLINDGESGSSTYIELNEIGSAAFENISFFATSSQGLLADSSVQPEDISLVATTGNYSDLNNIPITFQPSSHTHVISEVVNLQTVLDGKIDENLPIISGTGTKLTVDTKGLVTNITNATTLDINDSINRRYVTDANIIDIGNLSGINSGDQSSIVGITGTKSQFNTAVTDADILYVGDITQYTDELAQDAVGGILTDTTTIDLSYNDILNIISADIKPNSITSVELADNINISEFVNTTLLPYTGAISNTDLGEYQLKAGQLEFDQTPTGTTGVAILRWNDNEGTLDLGLKGGNVTLQLGQEQIIRIVNKTGVNLLESAYQVIYISGAQGNRLKVDLALANSDLTSAGTIGLVTETINNNEEGFITSNGLVRGINTTGSLQGETWIDGDLLYVSPIVAGRLTNIKPIAPQHSITIGICVSAHITQGSIFVKVDNGYELEELHNVLINTPVNNQILTYESATSLWKNKTVSDALGFTPVNPVLNISTTSPLLGGGNLTADRTLSIQQSTSVQDGYLSSTDFTTFNNKQPAGAYITSLTGEVTASGAGAAVATLSTPAVTGKILTGLNITGGSISATDSILSAFGKVQSQINGVLGGSIFQTTWNASTNTPTLTSSVGTKGYYYIVDVAGSTNLDGITDWKVGDWAIYDGTVWRKVDNTDAVSSVNGFTGAVSLTTSNITEGTNLYYTEGRVSANTDVAANTAVRHNAVTLGTTNGLSLSGQQISLGLSSTSTIGALSSTDWNVFNNKQNALGFTPENITNKSDSYTASSSTTYASTKALVDGLGTKASLTALDSYLPLTGGTLTGGLSGTSGVFSNLINTPALISTSILSTSFGSFYGNPQVANFGGDTLYLGNTSLPLVWLQTSNTASGVVINNNPVVHSGNVGSYAAPISGSTNYIQNQNSVIQSANMRISGQIEAESYFSSYIGDGLFDVNARPSKIKTPGGKFVNFGYFDYGGGQYNARIGFTNNTNWSLGSSAIDGNSFSISTGSSDDKLTISNTGAATFSSDINVGGNIGYESSKALYPRTSVVTDWYLGKFDGLNGIDNAVGSGGSFRIGSHIGGVFTPNIDLSATGAAIFASTVTSTSFIKLGGTSSQFLKADGSIDNTIYTPSTGGTGYIQNQNASAQSANMWISGTGKVGSNFELESDNPELVLDSQSSNTFNKQSKILFNKGTTNLWRLYNDINGDNTQTFAIKDVISNVDVLKFNSSGAATFAQKVTAQNFQSTQGYLFSNNEFSFLLNDASWYQSIHAYEGIFESTVNATKVTAQSDNGGFITKNAANYGWQIMTGWVSYFQNYLLFGNQADGKGMKLTPNGDLQVDGTVSASNGTLLGGTGIVNYIPKFTTTGTLGNSLIQDDGTRALVSGNFRVDGTATFANNVELSNGRLYQFIPTSTDLRLYDASFGLDLMKFGSTGNVLIGTTSDDTVNKLQVNGSILATKGTFGTSSNESIISIDGSNYNNNLLTLKMTNQTSRTWGLGTYLGGSVAGIHFYDNTSSASRLAISEIGNVLINTTTDDGSNKLQVAGSVRIATTPSAGNIIRPDNVGSAFQFGNGVNTAYGEFRFKSDGGSDLAVVKNTGNIGIGTTSPLSTSKLHIVGGNTIGALVVTGGTAGNDVNYGGNLWLGSDTYYKGSFSYSYDNKMLTINGGDVVGNISFKTSTNERARITTGGNFLLNTTTDNGVDKLQVNGSIYASTNLTTEGYVYSVGSVTGSAFYKSGGTSSQFLKANGSVDSTIYAADDSVVHITGSEEITGNKFFSGSISTDTDVTISGGASLKFNLGTYESSLSSQLLTSNRGYDLPDASGTIALVETIRPYKVYTALLSQSGTSAPTATVLENTLGGTVVWTRDAVGVYRGTLTGAFNQTKTVFFTVSNYKDSGVLMQQASSNDVTIGTFTTTSTPFTAADSIMGSLPIEIRVYN